LVCHNSLLRIGLARDLMRLILRCFLWYIRRFGVVWLPDFRLLRANGRFLRFVRHCVVLFAHNHILLFEQQTESLLVSNVLQDIPGFTIVVVRSSAHTDNYPIKISKDKEIQHFEVTTDSYYNICISFPFA